MKIEQTSKEVCKCIKFQNVTEIKTEIENPPNQKPFSTGCLIRKHLEKKSKRTITNLLKIQPINRVRICKVSAGMGRVKHSVFHQSKRNLYNWAEILRKLETNSEQNEKKIYARLHTLTVKQL